MNARDLPPELERGLKLAHRSQTFAIKLPDGRDLYVRREAVAFTRTGVDTKKLAAGGGELVWWVRCGNSETTDPFLAQALHRVVCAPVAEDDADGHWDQIKTLFAAAMALTEVAVAAEQQAVVGA